MLGLFYAIKAKNISLIFLLLLLMFISILLVSKNSSSDTVVFPRLLSASPLEYVIAFIMLVAGGVFLWRQYQKNQAVTAKFEKTKKDATASFLAMIEQVRNHKIKKTPFWHFWHIGYPFCRPKRYVIIDTFLDNADHICANTQIPLESISNEPERNLIIMALERKIQQIQNQPYRESS